MPNAAKWRQGVIDGYLNATGRNAFMAGEFIDWLADKPDHEAYEVFYGKSDEDAAREWRIARARQFISGLRITVRQQTVESKSRKITVVERTFPAFISPLSARNSGGGHLPMEPDNPERMEDHRGMGRRSMAAWIERYGDAFPEHDLSALKEIAGISGVVVAAE